jgi:hypothetical protein
MAQTWSKAQAARNWGFQTLDRVSSLFISELIHLCVRENGRCNQAWTVHRHRHQRKQDTDVQLFDD